MHPELAQIKAHMISSIPKCTASDAFERAESISKSLCYEDMFILGDDPTQNNSQRNIQGINAAFRRTGLGAGTVKGVDLVSEGDEGRMWGLRGDKLTGIRVMGGIVSVISGEEVATPLRSDENGSVISAPFRPIDVKRQAEDFGLDISDLKTPETVGFVPLHRKPVQYDENGTRIISLDLGMRALPGDPKSQDMVAHYIIGNFPHPTKGASDDEVIGWITNTRPMEKESKDLPITGFVRNVAIIPKDRDPFLMVYPIQLNEKDSGLNISA